MPKIDCFMYAIWYLLWTQGGAYGKRPDAAGRIFTNPGSINYPCGTCTNPFKSNQPVNQPTSHGDTVYSKILTINTGAPQGCVLSPALFTLYTNDCKSTSRSCTIVKYDGIDCKIIIKCYKKRNCISMNNWLSGTKFF